MLRRSGILFAAFIKPNFRNSMYFKSSNTEINCLEIKIPVPWGHIAGKWWGPTNIRPILIMHGWQDNCGSFNRLLPLITEDVGFLAIDFPGHGYSSHYPSGFYYHNINYVILIQYLVNYFKWPQVSLMGHSLGARTSFLYSIINPQNVDFFICLDGLKPLTEDGVVNSNSQRISKFLQYDKFEEDNQEPPSYTMEEIKEKVCSALDNSIAHKHSHHIVERNVAPSKSQPGKYHFTRDPRLKVTEMINWPQDDLISGTRGLRCPVFVGKAIGAPYYEAKEYFHGVLEALKESSVDCQYHLLEGTHHLHLNNPEVLAGLVKKFLKQYDKSDRSVGGIKEEMVK